MRRVRTQSASTRARINRARENRRLALAAVAEGRVGDVHPSTLRSLFSRRLISGSLSEPGGLTEQGEREHAWNVLRASGEAP